MENMIKKIVDADNEAKAMEKDTLEEKEELSKTIEAETKKIYDDFMAKAEEVVKRNDIQEAKKSRTAMGGNSEQTQFSAYQA